MVYCTVHCICCIELTAICRAFRAVHVEENGLNQSVDLMVLLTSHHAMLAATTYSDTPSVISSSVNNEVKYAEFFFRNREYM